MCGLQTYLALRNKYEFAELLGPERQRVIDMLQSCPDNEARRLAMTVRNFYVGTAYSILQESLAKVNLNLFAPASYLERNSFHLPPTRFRYDAANHEIGSIDGTLIDYLVVGSGPAGSVLAHELRRGGKRVLLIERGSLVAPGSMESRSIGGLVDRRSTSDGGIYLSNGAAVGGGSLVEYRSVFCPDAPDGAHQD